MSDLFVYVTRKEPELRYRLRAQINGQVKENEKVLCPGKAARCYIQVWHRRDSMCNDVEEQ